MDECDKLVPEDKKELDKLIADFHGIGVLNLLNSPNYEILYGEYTEDVIQKIVEKAVEIFQITEKQAWALVALGGGLLD